MRFRDRLFASIRAMQPVIEIPGVMVGGSQVPNLLEPDVAATLVVSQDVDLVIPVSRHAEVKKALDGLRGYTPSSDEPSVWLPDDEQLLEMNFIGLDPSLRESSDTYVLTTSVYHFSCSGCSRICRRESCYTLGTFE